MIPAHPRDFLAAGWHIGLKPDRRDFGVIHSRQPANAAGLFTRNNFPGHAVTVGREHLARSLGRELELRRDGDDVPLGAQLLPGTTFRDVIRQHRGTAICGTLPRRSLAIAFPS